MDDDPPPIVDSLRPSVSEATAELTRAILDRFDRVTDERLQSLAFVAEARHLDETGERATDATYYPQLTGCHSPEVDAAVDEIDGVERDEFRIAGDKQNVVLVEESLDPDPSAFSDDPELASEIVDGAVDDYAMLSGEAINRVLSEHPAYRETKLGDEIDLPDSTENERAGNSR